MSKLSNAVSRYNERNILRLDETVENFMGGDSYVINPLDTLKMVTASSIFGEPAYYRAGRSPRAYVVNELIRDASILPKYYEGKTTEQIMESAIDAALDFDFEGTIRWAKELRTDYMMRLNPQVIMVRAAIHPKRIEFTDKNPRLFDEINQVVMSRVDEPMSQMAYYLYLNKGKKNKMPSILKRSWANRLGKAKRYHIAKYKNHEIGMVNAVRLCHAHSEVIDELMRDGTVEVPAAAKTWENLRSEGKSWKEIFYAIDMGHMALLRNIRGVFSEIEDRAFCRDYLAKLKEGVLDGKQFPFRYFTAYKVIEQSSCHHKPLILDALEECMDIALANCPKLEGKTMCLSDNSGSAWGAINSEYGTVKIAEIDNLSSIITAACSEEGYVGKFGDRLITSAVSKRQGLLAQTEAISKGYGDVGGATEGGIWEFFHKAIVNKEHWDNIFIYSDQQAGHGGLYGTTAQKNQYNAAGFGHRGYINVFALVEEYRRKVNPKVNVFSIQTAGYDNVVIPEYAYRTNIMYGWTGKEAVFAKTMIDHWNSLENRNI